MDQLSRSDDLKERLGKADWDLVVVDEAHRMSAHYFGSELKKTKRYQLGELLGRHARHLLLMTATPHAGREEDFQLFLALPDTDRFEGRYRDAVHTVNTDGLMRRVWPHRTTRTCTLASLRHPSFSTRTPGLSETDTRQRTGQQTTGAIC